MTSYEHALEASHAIRAAVSEVPRIAVVLGSGLGAFADRLESAVSMAYADIPHWPPVQVAGHDGRLAIGSMRGIAVAAVAGRCHLYEGYDLHAVTFAVRALGLLGVRSLILTNAAGGINPSLRAGDLMVIDDHLNLMGGNPLAGPNDDRFGVRFPDLTDLYSARLRALADEAGKATGVELAHGVYAALLGPSYETPAEIRYLRAIGADAVGMSTVPEVCVARHMGARVIGISCITNQAAGNTGKPVSHDDVTATAARVRETFETLLEAILGALVTDGELPP